MQGGNDVDYPGCDINFVANAVAAAVIGWTAVRRGEDQKMRLFVNLAWNITASRHGFMGFSRPVKRRTGNVQLAVFLDNSMVTGSRNCAGRTVNS